MKAVDLNLRIAAIAMLGCAAMVAGAEASVCNRNDIDNQDRVQPSVLSASCGINGNGKANGRHSISNEEEILPGIASAGEEAGQKKRSFGGMAYSTKKWLESADEKLREADAELLKTEAELNISKATQNIDEAWLDAIKAMQCVSEAEKLSGEIVEFAGQIVQKADKVTEEIFSRALKRAKGSLREAYGKRQDSRKQLLSAIEAIENADVAGNTEAHIYITSNLMQESIGIVIELITASAEDQCSNEMREFSEATRVFGEAIQGFKLNRPCHRLLRDNETQAQSAIKLRQGAQNARRAASRVEQGAIIMGLPLPRIVHAIGKATYRMMEGIGAEVSACGEGMLELREGFKKAVEAFNFEYWRAKGAVDVVAISVYSYKMADELSTTEKASSLAYIMQSIGQAENGIGIDKVKERYELVNERFNKMAKMIAEKEQIRVMYEKDKILQELASSRPVRDIDYDAYVHALQRNIVGWRINVFNVMKYAYDLEKNATCLKQCVAEIERGIKNKQTGNS